MINFITNYNVISRTSALQNVYLHHQSENTQHQAQFYICRCLSTALCTVQYRAFVGITCTQDVRVKLDATLNPLKERASS